jgi:hypothetical protein
LKNLFKRPIIRRKSKTHLERGYWLAMERIEVPGQARDDLLLVAVNNLTGERHPFARIK